MCKRLICKQKCLKHIEDIKTIAAYFSKENEDEINNYAQRFFKIIPNKSSKASEIWGARARYLENFYNKIDTLEIPWKPSLKKVFEDNEKILLDIVEASTASSSPKLN